MHREKMLKLRCEEFDRQDEEMRLNDEEHGPVDQSPLVLDSLPPS